MNTIIPERPYPKPRRSAPKTRTGCGTCRIRRVKCDEAKPICQRCIKFGVDCDGYEYLPPKQTSANRRRKLLPSAEPPKIPACTTTTVQPKVPSSSILASSLFKNTEEAQYFNLFCQRTGYDIFPTFDSGHTRHRLLESAHINPSILHAIIALGALDKCTEIAYSSNTLSLTSQAANHHHQNAIKQYAIAIKHMTLEVSLKTQDLRTMLLTSLLILAFESWTGNMDLAVKQVHTSIRLIQEWKENYRARQHIPYIPLSPSPYEVEDDLIQIFCRLAVQHSFFADGHSKELHTILGMEGPTFTRSMPAIFEDVYEAGKYYNGIIRRGVYLITTHSAYLGPAQNDTSSLSTSDSEFWKWALKEQEEIQGDVWRFNKAFAPVLERVEKGHGARKERHYALFIQMSLAVGYIGLSTHLSVDEGIHDSYNPVYRKVVDLAKLVLKEELLTNNPPSSSPLPSGSSSATNSRRKNNFCFDTRVIVPLWVVGLKCREPTIRREAIQLLLSSQRREGIWDSVFAGKVLEWAMLVEERFMVNGQVSVWARLEGVKWSGAELGAKRAELICWQREREGGEMVRRTKVITW